MKPKQIQSRPTAIIDIRLPSPKEYRLAEIHLALNVTSIEPCKNCQWPCIQGNYCTYCGFGA